MKARDNPLRATRVLQVRFRPEAVEPGLTMEALLRRWEQQGRRGALVGPHGSGKTTLLEDIGEFLTARGESVVYLRLSRERRHFTPEDWQCVRTAGVVLLFDGAEQLNRLDWARFLRHGCRAGGMIVTTHRGGMLPALLHCHTSPALLRELLTQLLGDASREFDCQALWSRHGGDLRLALREVYDFHAALGDRSRSGQNVA